MAFQAQQGLLGNYFGGGLGSLQQAQEFQQAFTTTIGSSSNWSINIQNPIEIDPPVPNNDPVAWLKKRVKEIEWRA